MIVTPCFDHPLALPVVKIPHHRGRGRNVAGQSPPLASGGPHLRNGMEDVSWVGRAGSSKTSLPGDQGSDEGPFLIGHVAFIAAVASVILRSSGPILWHGVSSKGCYNLLGIPPVGDTRDL